MPAAPAAPLFNPPAPETRYTPTPAAPEVPSWQPNQNPPSVRLGAPEPFASGVPQDRTRLYPPVISEKVTPAPPKMPVVQESTPPPALPVGIPQFASARDKVAGGLRPLLDDGLDWLKDNGFRTVLHLRRPGEDTATDRKQVEKRGMKYLSLEVSPLGLSKQLLDEFNRTVGHAAGHPLFVYDRDGALAGSLWYLHFRTVDGSSDEVARIRAAALGLREERDGLHREMWEVTRQFSREQLKLP
jgi:protein tyrosine phosphatase (PTP) superfamily phosphohydrolase (DUF442 family)